MRIVYVILFLRFLLVCFFFSDDDSQNSQKKNIKVNLGFVIRINCILLDYKSYKKLNEKRDSDLVFN